MKCERCGRNEATYFYRENINGQSRELHLCADCARQSGLGVGSEDFFSGFFNDFPGVFDSFFSPFGFGRERQMCPSPRQELRWGENAVPTRGPAQSEAEAKISGQQDETLRQRRESGMLRQQLREAVEREDYETAARLRDELKGLENK